MTDAPDYVIPAKNATDVVHRLEFSLRNEITQDEAQSIYTKWAKTYDHDMIACDRHAQDHCADALLKALGGKTNVRILDVAAGTGVSGQAVKDKGFTNIDALDVNENMLSIAKQKNIYKNFIYEKFGAGKSSIPDNTYDALICVGSVYPGHILDEAFTEMVRIVKSGGPIVLSFSESLKDENTASANDRVFQRLQDQGKWTWKKELVDNYIGPDKGFIYTMIVQ